MPRFRLRRFDRSSLDSPPSLSDFRDLDSRPDFLEPVLVLSGIKNSYLWIEIFIYLSSNPYTYKIGDSASSWPTFYWTLTERIFWILALLPPLPLLRFDRLLLFPLFLPHPHFLFHVFEGVPLAVSDNTKLFEKLGTKMTGLTLSL